MHAGDQHAWGERARARREARLVGTPVSTLDLEPHEGSVAKN